MNDMDKMQLKNIESGGKEFSFALSIAGFDPSAGAGLLSDIKTFERQGVYGLGVITCNTLQTDNQLLTVAWQELETILDSIQMLSMRYKIRSVKIGAVRDKEMFVSILKHLKNCLPEARIVWDPVYKASIGKELLQLDKADLNGAHSQQWKESMMYCDLITPNALEAELLCKLIGIKPYSADFVDLQVSDSMLLESNVLQLSKETKTAILLKGGHLKEKKVTDRLYLPIKDDKGNSSMQLIYLPGADVGPKLKKEEVLKHGSGCVHSSTVAAFLAKGVSLEEAAASAKDYMINYLHGSKGPLAMHPRIDRSL